MILKKIFDEITFLGGILFYLIVSFLFLYFQKQDIFLKLILALISVYLITAIIRMFYFKNRPKKLNHSNFLEKLDASSFPSIHAARATLLFILFSLINLEKLFLIAIMFLLLLSVYYSRIYLKKHDIIDILGGIILGILVSLIFRV